MGIEPTSTAWEAVVLPMNYIRIYLLVYFNKLSVKSQGDRTDPQRAANTVIICTVKHVAAPKTAGNTAAAAVHFRLWVSLCIVCSVVVQGQCIMVNSSTHRALDQVQPFAINMLPMAERDSLGTSVSPER